MADDFHLIQYTWIIQIIIQIIIQMNIPEYKKWKWTIKIEYEQNLTIKNEFLES